LHIVWEFHPKPERIKEFETVYGAEGDWAALFRKSPHYRETILTRDLNAPGRYLLTDIWDDRASFSEFKSNFRQEYDRLDKKCESLTLQETRIGEFETL
jgi:heme-degrading monooxygenase HmoA